MLFVTGDIGIDRLRKIRVFKRYRRKFDASKIVLGGNSAPGAEYYDGGGSNYIVAVVPEGEAPVARDSDDDGRPDSEDNCSLVANAEQSDCDQDGRAELYNQIQVALYEDQPYCWLDVPRRLLVVSGRVGGINPGPWNLWYNVHEW